MGFEEEGAFTPRDLTAEEGSLLAPFGWDDRRADVNDYGVAYITVPLDGLLAVLRSYKAIGDICEQEYREARAALDRISAPSSASRVPTAALD